MEKVEGQKKDHEVRLFALSTCMWCRKTKKLFEDNLVEYEFVDVDLLEGSEREQVVEEVEKHNPSLSFPTIVIDRKSIVGYKEDELKGALGL